MMKSVNVVALNQDNIFDRLGLCWGHIDDWKNSEIVQKSVKWLEKVNAIFTPSTFIAYEDGAPSGMIEFVPQKLLNQLGLCPCRVDSKSNEIEERYILGKDFENYLFISCLFVNEKSQGRGVGKALLNHLLKSEVLKHSNGAFVYVKDRDESWAKYIHWPAGPKEFYLKAGFVVEKTLHNPTGHLLSYHNTDV